jgi:hypothetical protein
VCGFLFVASKLRGGRDARAARLSLYAPLAAMGMTALLLAPWSLFASRQQGSFVALSTTSGYNLYLGTGVPPVDAEDGSLPARAARALGLRGGPEALPQEPAHAPGAWSSAAWSAAQGRKARALWAARPVAETLYGAAKVLHAFGFSLRGARDALLALFFVAAAAAAATLRRLGGRDDAELRAWVVFFWLCALTVALQAFVWLPNQRLKTVLFDLPALWTLSLCLGMWLRRRRNDAMAK